MWGGGVAVGGAELVNGSNLSCFSRAVHWVVMCGCAKFCELTV